MRIAERYDIGERLGQGGAGTVYRGTDTHDETFVAIKQLNIGQLGGDPKQMLTRFRREGEILKRLNHPNIVKMLDMVEENGESYLVMELVEGGSLSDLLKAKGQLPISRVVQIGLDLCDALTRAHRLGVIHRDLKPANILLDQDGTPRLSDFGIARTQGSDITAGDQTLGTLSYLSPEALAGELQDERSDIWALGVILYEMLSGQRLFQETAVGPLIQSILTRPIPELEKVRPDAPIALVDLVNRMLTKNPKDRIGSVRIVGAELEALLLGNESTPLTPLNQLVAKWSTGQFQTPAPDTGRIRNNLPLQSTAFVGRDDEIGMLVNYVTDPAIRLVTILATGGMGKTRLALEVSSRFITDTQHSPLPRRAFGDGIFFIPLASLSAGQSILSLLAETFGYTFQQDGRPERQQVLDYLREKNMLLVFDNFEHLLDSAVLISDILQIAPGIKIVVTSRERLNLSVENVFPLEGMPVPDGDSAKNLANYGSIKLFIQSAQRLHHNFTAEGDDLTAIGRICAAVQGMPLGIVLASSWIETLSLKEIEDEISRSIDFLETTMRDVPERQRSIRAVFDYSFSLLSEEERIVFKKLAVFRGSFSRQAVQQVTGASLRALNTLTNRSLLRRDIESGRYDVHPLVRQYAASQLTETEKLAAEDAHSAYYANYVTERIADLKGRRQLAVLEEIEGYFEDIRAAWDWAGIQCKAERIDAMLESLHLFCQMRTRNEDGYKLFHEARERLASTSVYRRLLPRFPEPGDQKAILEQAVALSEQANDQVCA